MLTGRLGSIFLLGVTLSLAMALGLWITPAHAAGCIWTGVTDTDWAAPANWTGCGGWVPGAGDTATVPVTATHQPVIGATAVVTVDGLTLETGASLNVDGQLTLQGNVSGDGDLTVRSGGALWWIQGYMASAGRTHIAAGAVMTITGTAYKSLRDDRVLVNTGYVVYQDTGRLELWNNAVLSNTGAFDIQTDTGVYRQSIDVLFFNRGQLRKSARNAMSYINVPLHNAGIIQIESGGLYLSYQSVHSGTLNLTTGTTLRLDGTHTFADTSVLSGTGQVWVSGGDVNINGQYHIPITTLNGTLNLNHNTVMPTLVLSDSRLSGRGVLTVTKAMTWTGSWMEGTGRTHIAAGAVMTITGTAYKSLRDDRVLVNAGRVVYQDTGRLELRDNAVISNTGAFDIQTDTGVYRQSIDVLFFNRGQLRKSARNAMSYINVPLHNAGIIQIESGGLYLSYQSVHSGTLNLATGTTLRLDGTHTFADTSVLSGTGQVWVSGGDVNINGQYHIPITTLNGALNLNHNTVMPTLVLSDSRLSGSGVLTVTKAMTWTGIWMEGTGRTHIAAGAVMTITGTAYKSLRDDRVLVNAGRVVYQDTGRLELGDNAVISNTGEFDIQTDTGIHAQLGADVLFFNQGKLLKLARGALTFFSVPLYNTGTIQVASGGLYLSYQSVHSGTLNLATGTTLRLDGTHTFADTSVLSGTGQVWVSGGDVNINGAQTLSGDVLLSGGTFNVITTTLMGDFVNSGGTFNVTEGPFTFGSGVSQTVTFSDTTNFKDVIITESTTLLERGEPNNVTVRGKVINRGIIDADYAVDSTGIQHLGLGHAAVRVTTLGSLSRVQVEHRAQDHPQADTTTATGQYWHFAAEGIAYKLDIILPHAQVNPATVQACRYQSGSGWECRRDAADADSVTWADYMWDTGYNLSDWDWAVGVDMGDAVQTTVTPQRDQVLAAKDAAVILDFPWGIVNRTTDFVYTPLLTITEAPPSGMQFAGIAFELTAFRGGTPLPDLVFNVPLPMTIRYQDMAIQGLNESGLTLYRWDGQGWTKQLLGVLERDPGRNQLKVSTPFPARFALFGPPGCLPVDAVTVVGPETGYTGVDFVFAAVVTPTAVSLPLLYTWSPEPEAGQGTAVATYTWGTTGAVAVTASARNCGNTTPMSATRHVAIASPPPAAAGDAYENDGACQAASPISITGAAQRHTFHAPGDTDWISFTVEAGQPYVIAVSTPPTSTADVRVEVYDQCGGSMRDGQGNSFAPGVRMLFAPPQSGALYLKVSNQDEAAYGTAVGYDVAVALADTPGKGALILVAGKLKENDPVQSNIHNVTHHAYVLSLDNGCTDDDIIYLADDASLPGVDAVATLGNLEYALTTWAKDHVGTEKRLTLYLMDHGGPDVFYMNYFSTAKVTLTPQQLNQWLTELEDDMPGLETNVIIDACYAGSFIEGVASISQPGRLVMASTGANALAYATNQGAVFSDKLLNTLAQGKRLTAAFDESRAMVRQAHQVQTPWLDVDGDKMPNETEDMAIGLTYGFACASAPVLDKWPPYIAKAWVQTTADGHVGLWANVTDDRDAVGRGVKQVWATVYPPSYTPPAASEELTRTLVPPVAMVATNAEGLYGSFYPAFSERGTYRIVIQALDEEGMVADPRTVEVQHGGVAQAVYLPVVIRR